MKLPCGAEIAYQHWQLESPEAIPERATKVVPIHWFADAATEPVRIPLKFTPSVAVRKECRVVETASIGTRMFLKPGVDMAILGTALHCCIGASFTDPESPLLLEEIEGVLDRMGVKGVVHAQELLNQIAAFSAWITARWPDAIPYAEIPTEMRLPNGQELQGRIDMLLKVNGGWILIDHKSNPGGSDRWESIAQEYAGQLAAYRDAVEAATGEKVLENWLFLPVAAGAVRVNHS